MERRLALLATGALLAGLAACQGPISSDSAIVLPEGNADRGRDAFVALECTACHTVEGVDLPPPADAGPVSYALGGEVTRIRSYGELVTSVANPTHRLARSFRQEELTQGGESLMPALNDVMSVTQLTDIVAFLQEHYEIKPRPTYRYPVYRYGGDSDE